MKYSKKLKCLQARIKYWESLKSPKGFTKPGSQKSK